MSSSSLEIWEYRDIEKAIAPTVTVDPTVPQSVPGFTEEHVAGRVHLALWEAEQRWAEVSRQKEVQRQLEVQSTLQAFTVERGRYFRQLEAEVVHLALAIARKILGREASLDADLLAGLVRVELDRLGAGASVKIRVPPAELSQWEQTGAFVDSPYACEVIADASVAIGDCRVETDRGTAGFGLEGQLKEIEQGLLDLLARRPPVSETKSEVSAASPLAKAG